LARWGWHILAAVLCIIFAWYVWMLNPTPLLYGDQINIVSAVLSKQCPENFTSDPVWGGGKAADYYPPLWRAIVGVFIDKFGIIGGHRVMQFPLSVAYLFAMYGALYYLTRSVPAALLVALASIIWRWSMAETYWGLDRLPAVQPRSFVLIFMPLLFVFVWKLRNSWKILIPFFLAGLLFNFNPPSLISFGMLSFTSLFLVNIRNRQMLIRIIISALVFLAAASPYIYINRSVVCSPEGDLPKTALQQSGASTQDEETTKDYFSISAKALVKPLMNGFSVLVFLGAIAWGLRGKKRNSFDVWLLCIFLLAFVAPLLLQYANKIIDTNFDLRLALPNWARSNKFAYLILYIYIAWLLAQLFRRFSRPDRCILIVVTAVIVAMMPAFMNNPQDPWGQWHYNSEQKDKLLRGEKIEIGGWHSYIAGIANWARQKTPKGSLFLLAHTNMGAFRIYAQRSIVYERHAGGFAKRRGPNAYKVWQRYKKDMDQILARKDSAMLIKLADKSKADYVVVPNDFPKLSKWVTATRDQFWTVYKRP